MISARIAPSRSPLRLGALPWLLRIACSRSNRFGGWLRDGDPAEGMLGTSHSKRGIAFSPAIAPEVAFEEACPIISANAVYRAACAGRTKRDVNCGEVPCFGIAPWRPLMFHFGIVSERGESKGTCLRTCELAATRRKSRSGKLANTDCSAK
jgi:hypothetical protein